MPAPLLDLVTLLKRRLAVVPLREDIAEWCRPSQLDRVGAATPRRGFPRTHRFARTPSILAVAMHRCTEVFEPSVCVTLWRSLETAEEAFDARSEHWLGSAGEWNAFVEKLESLSDSDVTDELRAFEVVEEPDLGACAGTSSTILLEPHDGVGAS